MKRFFLALILCPLLSSLLFSIVEPIAAGRAPNFKLIIGILPIFYIFTFLGLIVFGLPIYFLLKKLDILNLVSLTISGGLTGIIYMVIFQFVLFPKVTSSEIIAFIPGLLMGAMSALIFGLLSGISLTARHKEMT